MTHRLTDELRLMAFESHDNCVSCGYSFKEGDTSHLGYDKSNKPLYVCDQCSSQLSETAVRQYFSVRPYEIPQDNSKLWRYMDFTKYVSLLSSSELYFARADTFQDIFEGAKGLIRNKQKWDEHYLSFFKKAITNPPEGYECNKTEEEIEEQANKLLLDLETGGQSSKKRTFISCWHENEHESEAMWKLYSSYIENAVAIRTTFKKLYLSLGRNPSINIGRVKYIDLKKGYAGVNDSFWRKRKSFEHEKEVRAIFCDHKTSELGVSIPCDLRLLIEELFVSPSSPTWFISLVNDVSSKYGLKIKVSPSELNEEPFY